MNTQEMKDIAQRLRAPRRILDDFAAAVEILANAEQLMLEKKAEQDAVIAEDRARHEECVAEAMAALTSMRDQENAARDAKARVSEDVKKLEEIRDALKESIRRVQEEHTEATQEATIAYNRRVTYYQEELQKLEVEHQRLQAAVDEMRATIRRFGSIA